MRRASEQERQAVSISPLFRQIKITVSDWIIRCTSGGRVSYRTERKRERDVRLNRSGGRHECILRGQFRRQWRNKGGVSRQASSRPCVHALNYASSRFCAYTNRDTMQRNVRTHAGKRGFSNGGGSERASGRKKDTHGVRSEAKEV